MMCSEAIRAIEARIDGEISAEERLELEAHLISCPVCRGELEDRRAFSDQLGGLLKSALEPVKSTPSHREECVNRMAVVPLPRRPWLSLPRMAAALILGLGLGYAISSDRWLGGADATEAREVAALELRREAIDDQLQKVSTLVEDAAGELDRRIPEAPVGSVRDLAALCVASAAARLSEPDAASLPSDPREGARLLAKQISSKDWRVRGRAVWAFRHVNRGHAAHLKGLLANLRGSDRAFAEMVLQNVEREVEPAIEIGIESRDGACTFQQFDDARVRVMQTRDGKQERFEAASLEAFRAQFPHVVYMLQISGVDGDVEVAGLRQASPSVTARPVTYVSAVVWGASAAPVDQVVEAAASEAILADLRRQEQTARDAAVQRAAAALNKIRSVHIDRTAQFRLDDDQIRRRVEELRKLNVERLARERERLTDEVASLEVKFDQMTRQLASLRKVMVTLEAQGR
ncbi:MAG: zf-HC2 domain-containing protein [Planctomycetes bacterium]|nr:zf-HC2 domain-containing protein [Planctomycetota bacterium]